ncbi:MAG: hypothetical protein NC226_09590 [Bacteroides cellulosilyticus]|nr:hypothetical protein [Bacteroides cellulosilyticus]
MKSKKAKAYIKSLSPEVFPKIVGMPEAIRVAEIAYQEAEERMREKATAVFCAANCPKGCPFGADSGIGCGAKYRFIQNLNDDENY